MTESLFSMDNNAASGVALANDGDGACPFLCNQRLFAKQIPHAEFVSDGSFRFCARPHSEGAVGNDEQSSKAIPRREDNVPAGKRR